MIKLYMVFYFSSSFFKNRGTQDGLSSLLVMVKTYFGLDLLALSSDPDDIGIILNCIILEAKRRLVEKDLLTFQQEAYRVNNRLWGFVTDMIVRSRADQATGAFLKETLSVVLN